MAKVSEDMSIHSGGLEISCPNTCLWAACLRGHAAAPGNDLAVLSLGRSEDEEQGMEEWV